MLSAFQFILTFIIIFILFGISFIIIYGIITDYLIKKYNYIINNTNITKCLNGCNKQKECPYGNWCFDCLGDNPSCCCYDFQCNKCE